MIDSDLFFCVRGMLAEDLCKHITHGCEPPTLGSPHSWRGVDLWNRTFLTLGHVYTYEASSTFHL